MDVMPHSLNFRHATRWARQKTEEYITAHEPFTTQLRIPELAQGVFVRQVSLRGGLHYYIASDEGILAVALAGNDGNLMVHSTLPLQDTHVEYLLEHCNMHSLWDLNGKTLPPELMQGYRRSLLLMKWEGTDPQIGGAPARVVMASDSPDEKAYTFIGRCMRECFGYDISPAMVKKRLLERSPEEKHIILEQGGAYVAQCHIQAISRDYAVVAGVATLPVYRGRGYAAQAVAWMCDYIRSAGRTPVLTVDEPNDTARRLYERCGFSVIGEVGIYETAAIELTRRAFGIL